MGLDALAIVDARVRGEEVDSSSRRASFLAGGGGHGPRGRLVEERDVVVPGTHVGANEEGAVSVRFEEG